MENIKMLTVALFASQNAFFEFQVDKEELQKHRV